MNRPARELHPRPALSAPVRPEITYQWEQFPALVREIAPLFRAHWQEIATNKADVPLDPNYDLFCQYALAGVLHVLTVRADGVLVGYVFAMIGPHLHYESTLWCHVDMFWLDPQYRSGWTGVRMFFELLRWCREKNARVVSVVEKLHFRNKHNRRVERLFRYLGFKPIERVFRLFLR